MTESEWDKVRKLRSSGKYIRGSKSQKFLDDMFNRGPNWALDIHQTKTLQSLDKKISK